MEVRINDEISAEYFMNDNNTNDINVAVEAIGNGTIEGVGTYSKGQDVVLNAIPDEGGVFFGWSDGSTENPRKFTATENVKLVAEFSEIKYLKPLPFNGTQYYFNKWFTDGDLSVPLKIVNNVAGENLKAFAIDISEAENVWDNQICCILNGNESQKEGNKFNMEFVVYWESKSDYDTAVIYLLTGKGGWNVSKSQSINEMLLVHDDWQWKPDINTEIVTEKEGGFIGYVHNQLREIPKNEWKKVSWGDELKIGGKGGRNDDDNDDDNKYIGIQLNLTNPAGTNLGKFYFRNIVITMGKVTYLVDYSDY